MLLLSLGSVLVFIDESLVDIVLPEPPLPSLLLLLLDFLFLDDVFLLLLVLLPVPLPPLLLLLLLLFDVGVDSALTRTMKRLSDLSFRRNFGWK